MNECLKKRIVFTNISIKLPTIQWPQPISILLYYFTRSCWYTLKTVEAILRVSVSVYIYKFCSNFPAIFFTVAVNTILFYIILIVILPRTYCYYDL